jgi:hypothetical protein
MANRTLRNRTIELNQKGVEFTAGESDSVRPAEQSEVLGSANGQLEGPEIIMRQVAGSEALDTELIESNLGQSNIVEVTGESLPDISMADPNDLRNLFANMLAVIKDSNKQMQALQSKVEESNKELQNKVAASNSQLQEKVRADIKSETEKLIKRFELENQRLS